MSQSENVVQMKAPMTAQEFRVSMGSFEREIGQHALVSATVGASYLSGKDDPPICVVIYPRGISCGSALRCHANDWDEANVVMRAVWSQEASKQRVEAIRDMALEIIKFTHETGACSDSQLRLRFSDRHVRELGAEACDVAEIMAGKAPFSITKTAKSNAA